MLETFHDVFGGALVAPQRARLYFACTIELELELELELKQSQMAQKPVLRGEVGAIRPIGKQI